MMQFSKNENNYYCNVFLEECSNENKPDTQYF